jgi:hypothetical protein
MRNMSINRFRSWTVAMAGVLLLAGSARAQQTPQNLDDTSAYGNAPYSNADTTPHRAFQPFAPVGFLQKFQPFAPVDISDYGNGIKPRRGFFFSFDRMEWTISRPKVVDIGAPIPGYFLEPGGNLNQTQFPVTTPVPSQVGTDTSEGGTFYESNSANTSQLRSKFGPGGRYEFGYMDTNDYGWLCSIISHVSQNQGYSETGATVLFNDPTGFLQGFVGFGGSATGSSGTGSGTSQDADLNNNGVFGRDGNALGVPATPDNGDARTFIPRFQYLSYTLHTELNGVEIMRMYRLPRMHNGAELDLLYGVRYFSFYDRFQVFGGNNPQGTEDGFGQQQPPSFNTGSTTTTGTGSETLPLPNFVTQTGTNIFDNFLLTQKVQNNLIGPQIGLRYAMQRGRWQVSTEGRFFAPANFQNTHQQGTLASNYINVGVQAGNPTGSTSATGTTGSTTGSSTTTTVIQSVPPAVSALETRNAPANMHPLSFMSSLTQTGFSPTGEIRLNATYEITRAFGVNFGYTGMYLGNIGRAPTSINYTLINMGIFPNNRENVFVNGFNVGFVFNR